MPVALQSSVSGTGAVLALWLRVASAAPIATIRVMITPAILEAFTFI